MKGINLPQCGIDRFTLLLPAASTQYKDSWQSTHDRLTQVLLGNHGKTYVLQIRDVITHYFTINYIHALGYSMVYTNTGTCILETNKIVSTAGEQAVSFTIVYVSLDCYWKQQQDDEYHSNSPQHSPYFQRLTDTELK